jgi:hypothetical protein
LGRSQNRTLRMSLARSPETGSVQKTVLDRAETIDFWLSKPGFIQKSEQSRLFAYLDHRLSGITIPEGPNPPVEVLS